MSPDGSKVLVDWQFVIHNEGLGPKCYNKDFTLTGSTWSVKNDATHWCWAQMRNGNLAVVSQNNENDHVQVYDVVAGRSYYILDFADNMGWDSGFHFFNTGKPGWAGMYTISSPYDSTHAYWDYDQIYLMELKENGRIWRVTFSQHKYTGDYFDEGHAQMDWHDTCTKLWFNANWRGTDNAEVYRVDLPEHWYEDLEGLPYTDTAPPAVSTAIVNSGDIKVVGSSESKGVIYPGGKAQIYFKGTAAGKYTCMIFKLNGQLVWQSTMGNISEGIFEWLPGDAAQGGYVAVIKGPGFNIKKKIAVRR
jgi:hypothetical protein